MTGGGFDFLVIIATFRRPDFLPEAIRSSLAQAGATKCILVVDDCPDGSARDAVAAIGDARVTYLRNPKPSSGGPSRVRNHGFAESRKLGIAASFIHFLDDDDLVPEGHYAEVKQTFAEHPDAGVVFGNLEAYARPDADLQVRGRQEEAVRNFQAILNETAAIARLYRDVATSFGGPSLARLLYRHHALFGPPMFFCGCCVLRRELMAELGGFDETVRLTEDLRFFGRAVFEHGVAYLDRNTCHYRVSDTSLTRSMVITPEQNAAFHAELQTTQQQWQDELRDRLGTFGYYRPKVIYKLITRPLVALALKRQRQLGTG
jgi:GT2 family glycosyltransferase